MLDRRGRSYGAAAFAASRRSSHGRSPFLYTSCISATPSPGNALHPRIARICSLSALPTSSRCSLRFVLLPGGRPAPRRRPPCGMVISVFCCSDFAAPLRVLSSHRSEYLVSSCLCEHAVSDEIGFEVLDFCFVHVDLIVCDDDVPIF